MMAKKFTKYMEHKCACENQIVWHFDKPTIVVCEECERTYYHDVKNCPTCGRPVSYYVKEQEG